MVCDVLWLGRWLQSGFALACSHLHSPAVSLRKTIPISRSMLRLGSHNSADDLLVLCMLFMYHWSYPSRVVVRCWLDIGWFSPPGWAALTIWQQLRKGMTQHGQRKNADYALVTSPRVRMLTKRISGMKEKKAMDRQMSRENEVGWH